MVTERDTLLAACDRLLKVEAEVGEMPKEQRDWFFGKEGHADCFTVARALKRILGREELIGVGALREEFGALERRLMDLKVAAHQSDAESIWLRPGDQRCQSVRDLGQQCALRAGHEGPHAEGNEAW